MLRRGPSTQEPSHTRIQHHTPRRAKAAGCELLHHPRKGPHLHHGLPDPRSYSRNKRGIAGSLVWINFDRHALLNLFKAAQAKFVADVDEIRPQFTDSTVDGSAIFTSSLVRSLGPSVAATINQIDLQSLTEVGGNSQLATPWYSDQILPFDITIAGANEYVPVLPRRSLALRSSTKVRACRSMTW